MANASAITVTALSANASTAQPAVNTFDTGTDPVTVSAAVGGETDRVILEVANASASNLQVAVLAGDNPPAFRQGLGNLTKSGITQSAVVILGPFDSSRFVQDDGTLSVTLTPTSTINATVRCYKLPKA